MTQRFAQSWSLLAQSLEQKSWLDSAISARIAQTQPESSVAWLQLYLSQNEHGLTAQTLADFLADHWHIKRAQAHEWQMKESSAPLDLHEWPQGVLWLGGNPACLGIVDASDVSVLQRLQFLINQPFEWRVISVDEYRSAGSLQNRFSKQALPEAIDAPNLVTEKDSSDAPVVRYLFDLMAQMVRERASDIHFEPFAKHYRIRARIDGVLHDVAAPDISLKDQLSVRLKVMAHLDIAEKRLPQDGRIKFNLSDNQAVDCRVSTLPTLFGEKIVVSVFK